ncbi:hypothetical protein [Lactobacillus gasseri]|uniref:hypothetical protein n=1 Tax=Lactobacillus gasseri TaxID=1596 RepID=UPI003B9D72F3
MKKKKIYKFGTPWSDWAWRLVSENKIILSNEENMQKAFFVYGKNNIEIAHYGDYLIQINNELKVKNS